MVPADLRPAACLGIFVAATLAMASLLPSGDAMLVVRAPTPLAAAAGAAQAGAALVRLPGPGLAILHGDSARIRAAFGLALPWSAAAPCLSPR